MSKRTQFRNSHKHRPLPKVIAETLNNASAQAASEPDKAKRKFIFANAFAGCAEWWKYKRLRNVLLRAAHRPHQGEREKARRVKQLNHRFFRALERLPEPEEWT